MHDFGRFQLTDEDVSKFCYKVKHQQHRDPNFRYKKVRFRGGLLHNIESIISYRCRIGHRKSWVVAITGDGPVVANYRLIDNSLLQFENYEFVYEEVLI